MIQSAKFGSSLCSIIQLTVQKIFRQLFSILRRERENKNTKETEEYFTSIFFAKCFSFTSCVGLEFPKKYQLSVKKSVNWQLHLFNKDPMHLRTWVKNTTKYLNIIFFKYFEGKSNPNFRLERPYSKSMPASPS